MLGDGWLDTYLTSPAWRFAFGAGACGDAPIVGVMVPSVDRVGRYFHLALVAELTDDVNPITATTEFETFFQSAEKIAIETLAADTVDFDRFDARVVDLRGELESANCASVRLGSGADATLEEAGEPRWQIPMKSSEDVGLVLGDLASNRLAALYRPIVLWWTDGSAIVEPSCLVSRGLPAPHSFAALLDGAWKAHQWRSIATLEDASSSSSVDTLIDDLTLRFRSAGASDVGRVRRVNQDAMLERTEVGVWAVADGLGGHHSGEVASQMICDALADFVAPGNFEQLIASADARIHEVNEYLVRAAARSNQNVLTGSTVVALLARGAHCAILWAGDSRVYRSRDGRLEQLTRDHSLGSEPGLTTRSNVVTRAIGADETVVLDVYRDRVRVGDRFLLCSDGLTKVLPDTQIQEWMTREDIRMSVDGLMDATLAAGAPDNVTALVVEAYL
jgi:type VI secretion system protein ImpM